MNNPNCWRHPRPEIKLEKDQIWPKLQTDTRRIQRRDNIDLKARVFQQENAHIEILDQHEYPELGEKVLRSKQESYNAPQNDRDTSIGNKMRTKHKIYFRKIKSSDPISINLEQILKKHESNICTDSKEKKYNANYIITVRNPLDNDQVMPAKRGKICISRVKRPSKMKQAILWEREVKRQINMHKNNVTEFAEIEPINKAIAEMDFNKLKIIPDPKIDIDIARDLATLNIFGQNYRDPVEVKIGDNTVETKQDITKGLQTLLLGPKKMNNRNVIKTMRDSMETEIENINESIIDKTLSLNIKDENQEVKVKSELPQNVELVKYSRKFREYCTNIVNPTLCKSLEIFLSEISRLQRKLYDRDNVKGRCKRRFYAGIKEVEKHVGFRKIKFVIIATDIEKVIVEGVLDKSIEQLIGTCRKQDITICFGLFRRKLGYLIHGKGFVSCIGIANYSGVEDKLETVLMELIEAKTEFKQLTGESDAINLKKILKQDDLLLSERVNYLLKIAASMT